MRARRLMIVGAMSALAGSLAFAQVGRGGTQWMTALGDAQRTSWVRADDKISVPALSKPGFELQWKMKLDNLPRGVNGLGQGVTAAGVTLFIPMSLVTGSSNNVYGLDNDTGYIVWQRQFDVAMPPPTPGCPGGISAGATRIVRLDGAVSSFPGFPGGRGSGYRSVLGEPGKGVPLEARGRGPGSGDPSAAAARGGARGTVPPAPPPTPAGRSEPPSDRIPGSPREEEGRGGPARFLFRPSGVGYVISSDGMLHVLGLPSGKDMQRPTEFLPANSKWTSAIGIDTTLYAATSAGCGRAPNAVWGIDLDSDAKPVKSWKTNGGPVVGAIAFASDGTLVAAIGAGRTTGDGKANAIVALDPKTLQVKDWFTQPAAEFVTGPTILRHASREIVTAATRDGRVIVLDMLSLGGADHATPLYASKPWLGAGASIAADALAASQQEAGTSWILLPISGRPASGVISTNGEIANGAVIALKLRSGGGGTLSLEPAWTSHDLAAPATPMTVNGVVFTLATGVPARAGRGTPAVLHAYNGTTGQRLWTSDKAMTGPASPGSFWTGTGQVYVGAVDGSLYAFGFNDERRSTSGQ